VTCTFPSFPDTLHPPTYVGISLVLSYAGGQLAHLAKAPRVVGYLFTGILRDRLVWEELNAVTHIALAVSEFNSSCIAGRHTSLVCKPLR
jgi:hypothetical protein